jgi:hypothetical protein
MDTINQINRALANTGERLVTVEPNPRYHNRRYVVFDIEDGITWMGNDLGCLATQLGINK